jgi:hypothetical protein
MSRSYAVCAYTTQGELVCGQQGPAHQQGQKKPESFFTCPADPSLLPLCRSERTMLIGPDGTCNHLVADPQRMQRCKFARDGCCQENGVPLQVNMARGLNGR